MKPELMLRMLAAPVTVRNFVKNDPLCNYEFYMVELLNLSKEMRKLHPKEFVWQGDQAHAECDAYSGDYGIDFKLIASQSRMKATSNFSYQYTLLTDGVTAIGESKANALHREKEMTVTRLHAAIRQTSLDDLERIRNDTSLLPHEKDIQVFLKKLETKKNLLLFYPYEFSYKENIHPEGEIEFLASALQDDFVNAFRYRSKVLPDFDTFLTTVYYNDFVLFRIIDNQLKLMDVVSGNDCPTFKHLRSYEEIWR